MSNGEALGSRNTCMTASLGSELHDTSRRRLLCQVQTVSRASEPTQAIGDSWFSDWHKKSSQNITSQAASLPHSESQHHSITPSPGIEITSKNLGEDRDDAQERKSALLEPSGVGQTASTTTRTSPHQHNTYTLHPHLQAAQNKFPPVGRQQVPGCGAPVTLPITLPTTNSDKTTSNEDPTPTTALLTELYQHTCPDSLSTPSYDEPAPPTASTPGTASIPIQRWPKLLNFHRAQHELPGLPGANLAPLLHSNLHLSFGLFLTGSVLGAPIFSAIPLRSGA